MTTPEHITEPSLNQTEGNEYDVLTDEGKPIQTAQSYDQAVTSLCEWWNHIDHMTD